MYIKEVEGDFDKLLFPVQAGELTDALASSVDDYMFAAGCLLDFAYGESSYECYVSILSRGFPTNRLVPFRPCYTPCSLSIPDKVGDIIPVFLRCRVLLRNDYRPSWAQDEMVSATKRSKGA